jgi:hypothetical protein
MWSRSGRGWSLDARSVGSATAVAWFVANVVEVGAPWCMRTEGDKAGYHVLFYFNNKAQWNYGSVWDACTQLSLSNSSDGDFGLKLRSPNVQYELRAVEETF